MKKGEIKIYYEVCGVEDSSDMYMSIGYFGTYEDALKRCCDLKWKAQYFSTNDNLDLSLKIIKITSEVMT